MEATVLGFANGTVSGVRDEHSLISTFISASYQGWEARAVVSSTPIEAQTRQLSDSDELDVVSVNATDTEDSPPQSRSC